VSGLRRTGDRGAARRDRPLGRNAGLGDQGGVGRPRSRRSGGRLRADRHRRRDTAADHDPPREARRRCGRRPGGRRAPSSTGCSTRRPG